MLKKCIIIILGARTKLLAQKIAGMNTGDVFKQLIELCFLQLTSYQIPALNYLQVMDL